MVRVVCIQTGANLDAPEQLNLLFEGVLFNQLIPSHVKISEAYLAIRSFEVEHKRVLMQP